MSHFLESGLTAQQRTEATAADARMAQAVRRPTALIPLGFKRTPGVIYSDMHSPTLGGSIRIGWNWDEEDEDPRFQPLAILSEIWAGPLDLGIHFDLTSSTLLEYELRRHLSAGGGTV